MKPSKNIQDRVTQLMQACTEESVYVACVLLTPQGGSERTVFAVGNIDEPEKLLRLAADTESVVVAAGTSVDNLVPRGKADA